MNILPTLTVNLKSSIAYCSVVLPWAYVIFSTVINPMASTVISLVLNTISAVKLRERTRKNAPRQADATVRADGKSSNSDVRLLISS